MAQMGYGYGSECHLLRWMGRHRQAFDSAVRRAIGTPPKDITWLDFGFDPGSTWADAEISGVGFVNDPTLKAAWRSFWPPAGSAQHWDAVGWAGSQDDRQPILVEAKAHLGELRSQCRAAGDSRTEIEKALEGTALACGATYNCSWLGPHYQYANRLAVVHFLLQHGYTPHLVLLYFIGDLGNASRVAPQSRDEWLKGLRGLPGLCQQKRDLGLSSTHPLAGHVHELFLHVCQPTAWLGAAGTPIRLP
jgi:hypothetical protein